MGIKEKGYCKICRISYDEYITPKLFPCCLQTACCSCIKTLHHKVNPDIAGKEEDLVCPYCQSGFDISTISFNENENLATLVPFSNLYKTCLNCENDYPIAYFCEMCEVCLCDKCFVSHEKINRVSGKEHTVRVFLSNGTESQLLFKHNQKCERHRGYCKKFYCSQCECYCCSKCFRINHCEHPFETVNDLVNSKRVQINQKVKIVSSQYGIVTACCDLHLKDEDDVQKRIEIQTKNDPIKSQTMETCYIIRFTEIALKSSNCIHFLMIASRLNYLLETILSEMKEIITWRSYPIKGFPAAEYIYRIMTKFCKRLDGAIGTIKRNTDDNPRDKKVNIGFVGHADKRCTRLVSKKRGIHKTFEQIEDEDDYNVCHGIPLPFIIVCFLENKEIVERCVDRLHKMEFTSELKSPVRTLLVNHCPDSMCSFPNLQKCLVVSTHKDDIRQGIASLVEETMFETFEGYEYAIDSYAGRDTYSLYQEFRAIKGLRHQASIGTSTNLKEKRKVPQDVIQFLSGHDDIVAFGIWNSDFRILTKRSVSPDIREDICRQLEETNESYFTEWKPSFYVTNEEMFRPFAIQQGDKISENGLTATKRSFGTLGGIAIGSEKLYGLTCHHVISQKNSSVYEIDDSNDSIGKCIFSSPSSPQSLCDFAVFEFHDHIISKCIRSLVDEENNKRNASLYEFDVSNLIGQYVHKKGASTDWTSGIIACAELHRIASCGRSKSEELMVFEGLEETRFAKEGDSGSLVIAHDLSKNRNNLIVIGMISGGELNLRTNETSAEGQKLNKYSIGFSLRHAIGLFNESFPNVDLHFDNEIKSSSSESDSDGNN